MLDLCMRDLEILDRTIYDFVIALGGEVSVEEGYYERRLKDGRLYATIGGLLKNEWILRYFDMFRGLEIPVIDFMRLLRLHLNRGLSFLAGALTSERVLRLFCLFYVDVIYELYHSVLKCSSAYTIEDCTYLYKEFVKIDTVIIGYNVRHLHIRNEIYDLTLHLLWFHLRDAWWIYYKPQWINDLLPFMINQQIPLPNKLPNITQINRVINEINHMIIDTESTHPSNITPVLPEVTEGNDHASRPAGNSPSYPTGDHSIEETVNTSDTISPDFTHPNLQGNTEEGPKTSGSPQEASKEQSADGRDPTKNEHPLENKTESDRSLGQMTDVSCLSPLPSEESHEGFYPLGSLASPQWHEVLRVSVVGSVYLVIFESYLMLLRDLFLEGLDFNQHFAFIQDLVNLSELVLRVDCNYTLWAMDKLGIYADVRLQNIFNDYERHLLDVDKDLDSEHAPRLYLLSSISRKLKQLQHELIIKVSSQASKRIVSAISHDCLYNHILYDEYYIIRPNGLLSKSTKRLPLKLKIAICMETFIPIIIQYIEVNTKFTNMPSESNVYDSLALWDCIVDILDLNNHPEIINEPNILVLSKIMEYIKFDMYISTAILKKHLEEFRYSIANPDHKPTILLPHDDNSPTNSPFFASQEHPKINSEEEELHNSCNNWQMFGVTDTGEGKGGTSPRESTSPPEVEVYTQAGYTPSFHLYIESEFEDSLDEVFKVWVNGSARSRVVEFGNLLIFYRDSSALQPIGFIECNYISSILSPKLENLQVHPTLELLDNYQSEHSDDSLDEQNIGNVRGLNQWKRKSGAKRDKKTPSLTSWGWSMRLELCGSEDAIDLEFMSPEHRNVWYKNIKRAIDTQEIRERNLEWWPYYDLLLY